MRIRRIFGAPILVALVAVLSAAHAAASPLDLAPAGDHVAGTEADIARSETFSGDDKILATYYFYWYDIRTNAHVKLRNGHDLLTDHPPTLDGFTYKSVDWHKQELRDMMDAGINVVLPVYWGDTDSQSWSVPGIRKLVQAWRELEQEGLEPPRIGLFYDTTSLMKEGELKKGGVRPDLTERPGKELFYKLIRDFYSLVPSGMRARIDGKPIAWLYSAAFASAHDQSTIEFADRHFARDFGGEDLYIVREQSWSVDTENVYAWGAALKSPNFLGAICIGPGYDDHAVPGRTTPVRERKDGEFYRESWRQALAVAALQDRNIMALETWNEYHEGTDIAASKEYGRRYIEMTAEYAKLFKKGRMPEDFPGKQFVESEKVSTAFSGDEGGITRVEGVADGLGEVVEKNGKACLKPKQTDFDYNCLYFSINPFYKTAHELEKSVLTVEYLDGGASYFTIQYDSSDRSALKNGAYKDTKRVRLNDSGQWKRVEFRLPDARFSNRQNGGADFRIWTDRPGLYIKSITLNPHHRDTENQNSF